MGSAPSCGIPRDAAIEIRFDRYLAPATAVRQSIKLYSGTEDLGVFTLPEYDVVERVVAFRLAEGALLEPGARYTVELASAESAEEFGFRAFDGAPLEEADVPLKFDFRTRSEAPGRTLDEPPPPACPEMLSRFVGAGCAGAGCHSPASAPTCAAGESTDDLGQCVSVPRMGLDLSSRAGLLATAIGRVAHQTETGSKTGETLRNPPRVGTDMPIIDPARPETSYLLYKLLRKPGNFARSGGCTTTHRVSLAGSCPEPSAEESERLREWFVRGEPMPLDRVLDSGTREQAIDLRAVQRWIRAGAKCP